MFDHYPGSTRIDDSLLVGHQQAFESMAWRNQEATARGGSFHWQSQCHPVVTNPKRATPRYWLIAFLITVTVTYASRRLGAAFFGKPMSWCVRAAGRTMGQSARSVCELSFIHEVPT